MIRYIQIGPQKVWKSQLSSACKLLLMFDQGDLCDDDTDQLKVFNAIEDEYPYDINYCELP